MLLRHLCRRQDAADVRPHEIELSLKTRAWPRPRLTTPAGLAAFTVDDLDEARSRLRRLALIWDVRLRSLTDRQLDAAGDAWTLRQVAFHVAESAFYADSMEGPPHNG